MASTPSQQDPAQVFDCLSDVAELAAFQVDAERNLVAWSRGAERLTGYAADDVLGLPCVVALRCPECMTGCGVFEHGSVRDIPLVLRRKDGSSVSVRKSGQTLGDGQGGIGGAVEFLRRREEEVSHPPMDQLLGAMGRGWLLADRRCRIVAASENLTARIGRPAGALRGVALADLLGADLFGADSGFVAALLAGERREGWHATLRCDGGGRDPVSISAVLVPGVAGGEQGIFVLVRPDVHDELSPDGLIFEGMVARSPAMRRIFRVIELLRDNDATVLVTGESGTGKELVARALHARSHRAAGPFVAVNCGALPGDLLESELFGHVRGAFTGAVRDRPGRFELADGGTLLLDEIGDMPLHLQVKLLRVLQTSQFERVGDGRPRKVDVRIIAATNADLRLAIAERRFRDDLYYRLRVVPVAIPPLRERPDDLEPLMDHLLRRIGRVRGRALRLSPSARRRLLDHPWPGNVRELDNALEYATAVCDGQTVHVDDLPVELREGPAAAPAREPPPGPSPVTPSPALAAACDDLSAAEADEARTIAQALATSRYRRAEAAELLGVSRTTLWRKMKQYRLD